MTARGRRLILGLALLAGLILVGWWLRPVEAPVSAPLPADAIDDARPLVQEAPPAESGIESVAPTTAASTFRGRVIDAMTREPVREFELAFVPSAQPKPPVARKFSTTDGRFEWKSLPAGQWTVTADAAGYQRFALTDLKLVEGKVTPEIVLPLRRGHVLRGRVYDEASAAGIASASITFREAGQGRYEGDWRMRPRTESGRNGTFTLNGAPAGRITLSVYARDYVSRELDIAVSEETGPLDIALSSGGSISGRLTAADGATAVVGSAGLYHDRFGSDARTTAAGEFSFQHLEAGAYRLTGQGPGGSVTREVTLAQNEHLEGVVLALRGGRTIRGTVTGLRPAELKAERVELRRDDGLPTASAPLNERGEYELRDVQPGRVQLAVDISMRRQLSRTVDVPANSDITVDFDFPRGARLSGRVTQRGRPVGGVWLEPRPSVPGDMYSYGASTSQNGDYVIEDLVPGEYAIRIEGFKTRPFQVAGDTVFDIDVPAAQLGGQVLEDNGKVPIAEAQLNVWPVDRKSSNIWAFDRSDHYGRFALAGLEPGDFVMTVYKPGYEMYRERIAYASPTVMTIRLARDLGVQVSAHDAAGGKPLQRLTAVEMIGDSNGVQLPVPLDEQGMGYIPGALAGATLVFWATGYATQTVSAWNGGRLELQFVREPAGSRQ
jgi:hypothetical protein